MITRKTIRFYDSPRDQKALEALNNYRDYGYDNANTMMVSALYKLIEHDSSPQSPIDIEQIATLVVDKLQGKIYVPTDAPKESINTSPSTMELDATPTTDDETLSSAASFIDSLF